MIAAADEDYRARTRGCRGDERTEGLEWNVVAYVLHVADNTRVWAERLAGAALGATGPIVPYDEDELARARGYAGFALPAARWSLERALGDWNAAWTLGGTAFVHPEQGEITADDAARIVAHELHHHALDVSRIVAG